MCPEQESSRNLSLIGPRSTTEPCSRAEAVVPGSEKGRELTLTSVQWLSVIRPVLPFRDAAFSGPSRDAVRYGQTVTVILLTGAALSQCGGGLSRLGS